MEEKNQKKEKTILKNLVFQTKDSIKEILVCLKDNVEIYGEKAYEEAIEDLFIIMMKVVRRAMRFVEYRSKTKILNRGDKISEKELNRCDFILKFSSKNKIKILKNNHSDIIGRFDRVEIIPE